MKTTKTNTTKTAAVKAATAAPDAKKLAAIVARRKGRGDAARKREAEAAERTSGNVRPMRAELGKIAGTQDWYLVLNAKGKQTPVRKDDLAGRETVAGPYETKDQAMCERTDRSAKADVAAELKKTADAAVAAVVNNDNATKADVVAAAKKVVVARKAAKSADAEARTAAVANLASVKAAKAELAAELVITLNTRGRLYFGTAAGARIEGMKHFEISADKRGVIVVAVKTKSADSTPMRFSHGHPVVRVGKFLADLGWNGTGSRIVAQPLGDAGFVLAGIKGVK